MAGSSHKKHKKKKSKKSKDVAMSVAPQPAGPAPGPAGSVSEHKQHHHHNNHQVQEQEQEVLSHRSHHVKHHVENPQSLQDLVSGHTDSFNFMYEAQNSQGDNGLDLAVQGLIPALLDGNEDGTRPRIQIAIKKVMIAKPTRRDDAADARLLPADCREAQLTYEAPITADIEFTVGNEPPILMSRPLGHTPVMVKSAGCHLQHMSRDELVTHKEEASELGGYFIMNGIERIMRFLIMPRRNHIFSLERGSFTNRGSLYTEYGTTIRCVRPDQSSITNNVHYLRSGSCTFRFVINKQEFFIPVMIVLRALVDCTDLQVYNDITRNDASDTFVADRVELMLRQSKRLGSINTREEVLKLLGSRFRHELRVENSISDFEAGRMLIHQYFLVHCCNGSDSQNRRDKYNILVRMVQQLYALVSGKLKPDNPDALSCQEILLPGHLFLMFFKEKLQDYLAAVRATILKEYRMNPQRVNLHDEKYLRRLLSIQGDLGKKLHYFMVTGNLVSNTGLDLMQTSGYTVVADKLNFFRYMSHFRSVHRGQFFTEMKTTAVRKLLPESWGFMCPVHTPDGTPCGLLNHLGAYCRLVTHNCQKTPIEMRLSLCAAGMIPIEEISSITPQFMPVMLDGIIVGYVPLDMAESFADELRTRKVVGDPHLPDDIEIAYMPVGEPTVYPGVYLHTGAARMTRPVSFSLLLLLLL
jgi:DNA-directed RNA polymerase I subunit RPA2